LNEHDRHTLDSDVPFLAGDGFKLFLAETAMSMAIA
jgi:hypothetical protein